MCDFKTYIKSQPQEVQKNNLITYFIRSLNRGRIFLPKKFKNIFISEVEKTRINILKYACKFHFGENPNKKIFQE